MATSTPDDRRRVKLPRSLPDRSRPQPYSRADAPYFRSPGFFVRIGGLAVLVGVVIGVLVLRAWSIQILHGPQYTSIANSQSFRVVDLTAPRGAIVDSHGRPLAGTTGHASSTPTRARSARSDAHGRWSPTDAGTRQLRVLSRLAGVGLPTLVAQIRRSVLRSPFAPAVVVSRPNERPRRLPRGARVELSRLQGDVGAVAHVSAGRARRGVPRPARRGQPERARDDALRAARSRDRSSGSPESRPRTTRSSAPASSTRTCASTRSGGSSARWSTRTARRRRR